MTRWLALVVVAACLREPSPPTFDDPAIAMACTAFATAECTVRQFCSSNDFNIEHVFGSDGLCIERESLTCINSLHVTDTKQSPAATEHCASVETDATCSQFFEGALVSACVAASGPGAIGSPCSSPAQCATGFCSVAPNLECGTCQHVPAFGASCEDINQCGFGIDCAIPSGSSTGACAAYVPEGQPCLTDVVPCEANYSCVGDASGSGTCVADVESVNLPCDNKHETAPQCNANAGYYCRGSDKTCQLYGLAGFGEPCGTVDAVQVECGSGGMCISGSAGSFCMPPAPDGQMCNTTTGPPCLFPAKCVNTDDAGNGVCVVANPADCF